MLASVSQKPVAASQQGSQVRVKTGSMTTGWDTKQALPHLPSGSLESELIDGETAVFLQGSR